MLRPRATGLTDLRMLQGRVGLCVVYRSWCDASTALRGVALLADMDTHTGCTRIRLELFARPSEAQPRCELMVIILL